MSKVKAHLVDKKIKNKIIDEFFEIISDLKNKKESSGFLNGLLTDSEVLMIARRIQIAKMLLDGNDYETIRKKLKISLYNISRIDRWLRGDEGRLMLIIGKVKSGRNTDKKILLSGSMLNKFAHHRLTSKILS
ncbi:MAG: YerC/YecD family TrpR-related protein [Parcubacteria group bacterium]|jgi:TrpR-related protein YerC/YecD